MKGFSLLKIGIFSVFIIFSAQIFADTPLSDSAITNEIKTKITEDPMLRHSNINVNVTTDHQVVNFSGVVNSESEASTLITLAQSTVDVKDVNTSNLTVKGSNQPLSDTYITAKVKGEFLKEKLFGDINISAWTIKVETNNAVVYLTGTSESKSQVENAVKLAQSISGVKQVKYRIKVMRDHTDNYEMTNN